MKIFSVFKYMREDDSLSNEPDPYSFEHFPKKFAVKVGHQTHNARQLLRAARHQGLLDMYRQPIPESTVSEMYGKTGRVYKNGRWQKRRKISLARREAARELRRRRGLPVNRAHDPQALREQRQIPASFREQITRIKQFAPGCVHLSFDESFSLARETFPSWRVEAMRPRDFRWELRKEYTVQRNIYHLLLRFDSFHGTLVFYARKDRDDMGIGYTWDVVTDGVRDRDWFTVYDDVVYNYIEQTLRL